MSRVFHGFTTVLSLLKETFQAWQQDKAAQVAAALAYYAVFSIAPLAIVLIAIAGTIFGEEAARGEIIGQIQGFVGISAAELVENAISNASRPELKSLASWMSLGVLLIGASGVFFQLQEALDRIWNVAPPGSFWRFLKKRLLSFVVVLFCGLLLILLLIAGTILSALSNMKFDYIPEIPGIWDIINNFGSFAIVTVLFALTYKYIPDARVAWRDVWMGAILTSLLFAVGKSLLGWYLSTSGIGSIYGAAGSLIAVLAWIYYSAQIFLFGAEFTQVYAHRFGSGIIPKRQLNGESDQA